ncbi:hypothetical protein RclHR1_06180012 [Rhizophagus clarus]|uniref:Homocysteine-responsive endoplasmic reticulum-resident ubiquitin-like domain member 2 protein n=1 Tax=Rhizophagus clarus TaxID=94130 RepID=A0A2Z6SHN4_9GLOM|nr:hypothetical protein RclHR1_06180012 [Rhizophagus clarus]GES87890.1 homocysteine-responsive endoplasmic reticulum-resident ubiquitin-like domain member 2 protein [Rhizophagus clarus]
MSDSNTSLNKELSSSNIAGGDNKVRIFIRSPTTPLPDGYSILTSIDSSVLYLKQTIFETHPLKPVVRDQKLIYRGRVLSDNDLIENVLKDGLETDQTFHLVVKPSFQTIAETTGIPISPPSSNSSSQNTRSQDYTQLSQQQNFVDNMQNPGQFYIPQNYAQYNTQNQQLPATNLQFQFPIGYYYVMINGLPYLMPVQYPFPYTYPYQFMQTLPQIGGQVQQQQPLVAPVEEQNHDNAARNQRRAATLWLVVKLGFLVYVFSQNASAERMILLYISALVIFLYQTGRLRIVRRRRRVLVPFQNEFFVQQMPQIPVVHNQAGNQPRPDGSQTTLNQNNNNTSSSSSSSSASSSSSPSTSSSSSSSSNNPTDNNNTPPSSTAEQQNNMNDNANGANEIIVPQQENGRSITLQDIEHALWTFVASLIPTNVAQQEEVGM